VRLCPHHVFEFQTAKKYCFGKTVVAGLAGRSSTPRLFDSITAASGILGHTLSRVMTVGLFQIHLLDLAACFARVDFYSCPPENQRAQGMPGVQCARSLACEIKKHTSIVTTVTPGSPGIPYAMVLTVSFALSSVTGLFVTVACENVSRKA
jgi:hypothetical protein